MVGLAACGSTGDEPTRTESNLTQDEAVHVATLDEVCPTRESALCDALHEAESSASPGAAYARARDAARAMVATTPRTEALTSPALRYYLRERWVTLLVHGAIPEMGGTLSESTYSERAVDELQQHFPAYDVATIKMAQTYLPALEPEPCEQPKAVVMFFSGVIRLPDRNEFAEQMSALAVIPCAASVLVDTGSFLKPSLNVARAKETLAEVDAAYGELPLHLVGYSQGATNVMHALLEPEIASRTRSVLTLNGAAHGSEVADVLYDVLTGVEDACSRLGSAEASCERLRANRLSSTDAILEWLAEAMGGSSLDAFLAAENEISGVDSYDGFLESRMAGIRSLTTYEAREFWGQPDLQLPGTALYTSFRSIITDEDANLPESNRPLYELLRLAAPSSPYNDMQVRLENQSIGGSVADLEVVGRVAEGNHWQWEYAEGALSDAAMPSEMLSRIPHRSLIVAYFQTLAEVGLLE